MAGEARLRWVLPWFVRVLVGSVCVLVLALPWVARSLAWALGSSAWGLVEWLDTVLALQCHRLPERVIHLGGASMAICSRCAGIYLGILLGALMARPRWSPRSTAIVLAATSGVLVLESLLELTGVLPVAHTVRVATGVAFSWPVSALAVRWMHARLRA